MKLKGYLFCSVASVLASAGGLAGFLTVTQWSKGGPPPPEPTILRGYIYFGILLVGIINLLGVFVWWRLFEVPTRREMEDRVTEALAYNNPDFVKWPRPA